MTNLHELSLDKSLNSACTLENIDMGYSISWKSDVLKTANVEGSRAGIWALYEAHDSWLDAEKNKTQEMT